MASKAIPYGAVELKRSAHRYWMTGLGISVGIHCVVIALYFLGIAADSGTAALTRPVVDHWVREIPVTIAPRVPLLPGIMPVSPSQNRPVIPTGALGTPEPMPDNPTNLQQTIMDQDAMGVLAEPGGSGAGTGESIVPEAGEEAEPPPFRVVEKLPVPLNFVKPVYPEVAILAGLEGDVWVKMWVDTAGKVRKAEVVKSNNDIFNDAAVEAALQCIFLPACMSSGPVSIWVTTPFRFRLNR